ncbi:ThiF family adenylyltransferase [Krasilnikoviella flava]|uniref:Adenylyltransferase and sulfurtransferase n=1 Tax=Krasilnikoviella flava TaxID=526729 RepID=A0A1T5JEK7_9MICO|nr:ThiF family adenylyltransferase [Krasilnikoviella flava]SKC49672.1 adenylyltransferase and sulfurtransferase [Krasilnikoviella flava]
MTSLAPLVAPGPELDPARLARYARHLPLPGVGAEGQRRLAAARVLVVGAGGLGSPALQYLAAAGVGTLGVVDDDVVDLSNLQRQVVHGTADLGRPKVESARDRLADLAPDVDVVAHAVRLTPENALDVVGGYDVVLDGADNFPTRYLVSDAAEVLGVPVVWGAIHQFDGQVAVFWGAPRPADGPRERGVTYRDVFPVPPPPGTVPDCATGGVLGALCGTVGSVMATEAVKLITGAGTTLLGRIAVYDALELSWRQLTVRPDPTREPVSALLADDAAYAAFCGLPAPSAAGDPAGATAGLGPASMTAPDAAVLLAGDAPVALVDVREDWEAQALPVAGARLVPSGTFFGPDGADVARAELPTDRPVLLVCAAGVRSARVADVARAAGVDARSVEGGAPALLLAV